jgi:hypothetical protein
MRYKCPQCGVKLDGDLMVPGAAIICGACQARLKSPPDQAPVVLKPIVLPPAEIEGPDALIREKTADLREQRRQRQDDRASNTIGGVGFALCLTTLFFMLSGAAVREKLPVYLGCATCFALPATLAGLTCSIIGCTRHGRSRILSIIGLVLGAILLVLLIPAAILSFKQPQ